MPNLLKHSGINLKNCESYHLDITNKKDTEQITILSPDIIIHTATLINKRKGMYKEDDQPNPNISKIKKGH